jgi:hypothetical protein
MAGRLLVGDVRWTGRQYNEQRAVYRAFARRFARLLPLLYWDGSFVAESLITVTLIEPKESP